MFIVKRIPELNKVRGKFHEGMNEQISDTHMIDDEYCTV